MGNKSKKEFDRSVCFSFFGDYRETARGIEEDFGETEALRYYNAIIDYALYGDIPEQKGILKLIWPTTKSTIDKSINRRASGFGREDKEMTKKILEYKAQNPSATQRTISDALGCSLGKVSKVLASDKKANQLSSNANAHTNTDSTSTTTVEREHERCSTFEPAARAGQSSDAGKNPARTIGGLDDSELKSLLDDLGMMVPYRELYRKYGLTGGCLDKTSSATIKRLLESRKKNAAEAEVERVLSENPNYVAAISAWTGYPEGEILDGMKKIKYPLDVVIAFYGDEGGRGSSYNKELYEKNRGGYDTFWDWTNDCIKGTLNWGDRKKLLEKAKSEFLENEDAYLSGILGA